MTLSWPSALAAATSASIPPPSVALVTCVKSLPPLDVDEPLEPQAVSVSAATAASAVPMIVLRM